MAKRQNTFLLKGSNIPGKIPSAGDLQLKELALNFADVILYASGTTSGSILPIGWDRVAITGDTMTGPLYVPTISATTYQNLPIDPDTYVTGGTVSSGGTLTLTRNDAVDVDVTGFTANGSGLVDTIIAGENLVSGNLVYLNTDGKYWKTDSSAEATSSTELRIATATILADASGDALKNGQYTTTGLTTGSTYWVSTGGTISVTQPAVDGSIVRYVGTALSNVILEFNPDELFVEISTNPSQVINPAYRGTEISGSILSTDWTVDVTTTGATTQTLPTAVGITGRVYNVKNSDNTGVGIVTIDTTSSQLIDTVYTSVAGGNPIQITYPQSLKFQSNGSGWIII